MCSGVELKLPYLTIFNEVYHVVKERQFPECNTQ
jgi:hypothetical protein